MRRILVICPASEHSPDPKLASYLCACSDGYSDFEVTFLEEGPPSVELLSDEVHAKRGVIEKARQAAGRFDAIVVNCFADPGVPAAREASGLPVIGPGEAAMFLATLLGHRFGVVSILRNSRAWVELQAAALGIAPRLAYSVGIEEGVRELMENPQKTLDLIVAESRKALDAGAEVIVLGCTGMARLANAAGERLSVPVIEPLAAAVRTAEALVSLDPKQR